MKYRGPPKLNKRSTTYLLQFHLRRAWLRISQSSRISITVTTSALRVVETLRHLCFDQTPDPGMQQPEELETGNDETSWPKWMGDSLFTETNLTLAQ